MEEKSDAISKITVAYFVISTIMSGVISVLLTVKFYAFMYREANSIYRSFIGYGSASVPIGIFLLSIFFFITVWKLIGRFMSSR